MRLTILLFGLFLAAPALSTGASFLSVFVDHNDQLHIVLDSGKEILPPKTRGQVSFGGPTISPDRRTVGWLVMCPDPTVTYYQGAQIGFGLALFRDGRVTHTFSTEQMFWDWQFQDGGKRVAYSTGPMHGGAAECVLRDVETGRTIAHWWVKDTEVPPDWAQTLRR